MLALHAQDPSLVPSTHGRQFTIACDSNSMGANALFWPLQELVHTQRVKADFKLRLDGSNSKPLILASTKKVEADQTGRSEFQASLVYKF